jgi:hypothetical protein
MKKCPLLTDHGLDCGNVGDGTCLIIDEHQGHDDGVWPFAGRYNIRDRDTIEQMCLVARAMTGKRLRYQDLVAKPEAEPATG